MSENKKDLYKILGVIDSAESVVIKASYKALMMIYHPDRNEDKEYSLKKSIEISEAYKVLIDPNKRRDYDIKKLKYTAESSGGEIISELYLLEKNNYLYNIKYLLKECEKISDLLVF